MQWIESSGGPLVLMERVLLEEWGGLDKSSDKKFGSDYDRACGVDDYAATLLIPHGEVVVLGDEPHRTTCVQGSNTEVILVRWRWAPNEETICSFINIFDPKAFQNSVPLQVRFGSKKIVLFDSSLPGLEVGEMLDIELTPGAYKLEMAMYNPNEEICLLLHRLLLEREPK